MKLRLGHHRRYSSAVFFVQCLRAVGAREVRLD